MPLPFCRAATVVGPAREGIQKKPSVRSPLTFQKKNKKDLAITKTKMKKKKKERESSIVQCNIKD